MEYPFDYDAKIISQIVRQYIEKADKPLNKFKGYDGSSSIGFLLQQGAGKTDDEWYCVRDPYQCIVNIRPFWFYCAK